MPELGRGRVQEERPDEFEEQVAEAATVELADMQMQAVEVYVQEEPDLMESFGMVRQSSSPLRERATSWSTISECSTRTV